MLIIYAFSVLVDGQPIQEFGGLPAETHNLTWPTNVREYTIVTLSLDDEAREEANSAPFVIQHGLENCTLAN
ncbi:hypothetical protein C2E23DRAFT_851688 [Lenzites betulinus]|nr:hypothetical protein C2E23DRAFT_851688 [Lenzites betulinus]